MASAVRNDPTEFQPSFLYHRRKTYYIYRPDRVVGVRGRVLFVTSLLSGDWWGNFNFKILINLTKEYAHIHTTIKFLHCKIIFTYFSVMLAYRIYLYKGVSLKIISYKMKTKCC